MKNNLNSGTIEALQPGQTLLVSARQVNGGKVQLEFAEKIQTADKPVNALTLLNASDTRFSSGARRCWTSAEPEDASKQFGVDFSEANENWYDTERGNMMDLNILNPVAQTGHRFRLQVVESTEANEWEANNIETAAKRAGKDGDFITHNGDYIFSRTQMVLAGKDQAVPHTFLTPDTVGTKVTANQGVSVEEAVEVADDMMI
tara:strand:+ start:114 stop:722 length:609 start_codon:yes stop_codon:yes gene_type:complete